HQAKREERTPPDQSPPGRRNTGWWHIRALRPALVRPHRLCRIGGARRDRADGCADLPSGGGRQAEGRNCFGGSGSSGSSILRPKAGADGAPVVASHLARSAWWAGCEAEIGRASCRERVGVGGVAVGG